MFVIFVFFDLFVYLGKRMSMVAPFFLNAIVFSAILGIIVSRTYSEPMNRILRRRAKYRAGQSNSVENTEIKVAAIAE